MPSGVGEGLEAGKRQVSPGCLTIAEASREFIATVVTSWVIVPFFFRSQWSSGVRSPVFFSPHRVATSRSYACTSASQFWQEIYAEIRTFLTCRGRYCICRQRGPLQLLVLQSVLLLAMHKSLVSPGVGSSLTFSPESRASGYEE